MPTGLDDGAAWAKLLNVYRAMMHRLEEMLQTKYQMTHDEFDVLRRLSRATDHRMRIRNLPNPGSALTRSGMSRLVDRLEKLGLVRREVAPEDARGAYAILTPAGQKRLNKAEASYAALVRESFLSLYTASELEQMVEFWMRFLNRESAQPDS